MRTVMTDFCTAKSLLLNVSMVHMCACTDSYLQVATYASEVCSGGTLLEGDAHPQDHVCIPHVLFQDVKHIIWCDDISCNSQLIVMVLHSSTELSTLA